MSILIIYTLLFTAIYSPNLLTNACSISQNVHGMQPCLDISGNKESADYKALFYVVSGR